MSEDGKDRTDVLFTDHAAARAFEYGIELPDVLTALAADHFKQPAIEKGCSVHYAKVDGRPFKIVTGPHRASPEETAIITLLPLDAELS